MVYGPRSTPNTSHLIFIDFRFEPHTLGAERKQKVKCMERGESINMSRGSTVNVNVSRVECEIICLLE
jgi:hypothetical protein